MLVAGEARHPGLFTGAKSLCWSIGLGGEGSTPSVYILMRIMRFVNPYPVGIVYLDA